ncbi:MAG: hypothetical protein ACRBDX_10030 [Gammaproteobacteria bacterium]
MTVTVKRSVTTLVAAMLLILVVLLIVSSIRPISLPFLSNYIRNQLENRFHAYYIDFEDAQFCWNPTKGNAELHLNSVRALDYGDNILASVPGVLTNIGLESILQGKISIQNIELQNPKISFIRTAGGALKFDIGSTDDGASGRVLETILIHMATTPITEVSDQKALTKLHIHNSDLTLGDEISASLLHVPNANISLAPNNEGIGCNYDFNVLARNENLHISGECLYKTSDEILNLLVNLDKVRPALLTEISPQFSYFTPLEVQLTGMVKLELSKLLSVNKAEFNLDSEKGSLELIDYFGKNLDILSIHIDGKALNNFTHVELNHLAINLEDSKTEANALFLKSNENLNIKINAITSGASITNILPRWFSYLENENLDCINTSVSNSFKQSKFTIDGIYDLKQHQISALGHISCLENNLAADNSGIKVNAMQKFSLDGAFDSPTLNTIQ